MSVVCLESIPCLEKSGYPRKAGQFKIKLFVVILSATHFSHYKILESGLSRVKLVAKNLNPISYQGIWRRRRQQIRWVNAISYTFKGADGKQKVIAVNRVVCEEEWEVVNSDTAEIETKTSHHIDFQILNFQLRQLKAIKINVFLGIAWKLFI